MSMTPGGADLELEPKNMPEIRDRTWNQKVVHLRHTIPFLEPVAFPSRKPQISVWNFNCGV